MKMKLPCIFKFLEEFDSNNIKKVGGAISFANHSALKEKYKMVPQKELPQVCPREDQAGVTHAISPISLKPSQSVRVTKLFKNTEWFGPLAHPWDIKAPTTNPWGKRLKSARKMHF